MSEKFNDEKLHQETKYCGDQNALVGYLYNECEPHERDAIAAHIAACATCTAEIEALGATRRTLAAWTPPEAALGFQITSAQEAERRAGLEAVPGRMLRPARWWQQPLPAWAQAAAALLIFAAGLLVGGGRGSDAGGTVAVARQAPAAVPAATPSASPDDLARVERQLRAEITRVAEQQRAGRVEIERAASTSPERTSFDERDMFERMQALIAASEQRQRADLLLVADAFEQRLNGVQRAVGSLRGQATEVRQHRQAIDALTQFVSTTAR